ncbi:MAG TPA: hypothetical protein VLC46_22330 [Thermoanaerobaculia bacterium]|jgi:hypothetical protein|nr:hypothetical protein [Thermoanaerobaculia bacterium]
MAVIIFVALVSTAAVVWPAARICRRAGYSPFLGFAAIVPLANIALLWFIALSPWQTNRR